MKMCMWVFNRAKVGFDNYGLLNLVIFGNFLHCRVWSLCNQHLLQFSMDVSQTWQKHCERIEDVHMGF